MLRGAADLGEVGALLLRHRHIKSEKDRGRGVDRHRGGYLLQGYLLEQELHIGQRGDGDAHLAHLRQRHRVVRVVADLRRQVEGDGEAGLAVLQQVAVALVGLLRIAEAGVLAHSPEPAAVHGGLDAAGVRVLAREPEPLQITPAVYILAGVNWVYWGPIRRLEGVVAFWAALDGLGVRALHPFLF